ncbi:MAG: hypothetical protein OEZ01_03450 [Candidatus Heimdallarchaeota archaeon]|nr:hypothetical protein [Candidatus Heimdallarchaeota archaeon]MDH5645033.1 hypothetical protein [Candidatus Heimdallarchaeota archaeon]
MSNKDITEITGYIDLQPIWPDYPQTAVEEGMVKMQIIESPSVYEAPIFFNPVMVLNRDFSLLFSKLYSQSVNHPIRVFEPLAGVGIRGFRLCIEIADAIEEVVICDFNDLTIQVANYNLNHLQLKQKIRLFQRECRSLAYQLTEYYQKYHYVDLDPFGSPMPFIDSIWNVMTLRSLVAVTATDMTALCGVYPDACLRKYGSIPLNNFHTHETAARILIAAVVKSASRHERGVKPIFTSSADHYVKIFFLSRKGRGEANAAVELIGFSYTCDGCSQIYYRKGLFEHHVQCCGDLKQAGPLWAGNIFDKEWCSLAITELGQTEDKSNFPSLATHKRMSKLLIEGRDGHHLPGYYVMSELSKRFGIVQPKFAVFKEKLNELGFDCVQSRFVKQAFRSNASGAVIKEILISLSLQK